MYLASSGVISSHPLTLSHELNFILPDETPLISRSMLMLLISDSSKKLSLAEHINASSVSSESLTPIRASKVSLIPRHNL